MTTKTELQGNQPGFPAHPLPLPLDLYLLGGVSLRELEAAVWLAASWTPFSAGKRYLLRALSPLRLAGPEQGVRLWSDPEVSQVLSEKAKAQRPGATAQVTKHTVGCDMARWEQETPV